MLELLKRDKKLLLGSFISSGIIVFYFVLMYINFFNTKVFTFNPLKNFMSLSKFPVKVFFVLWFITLILIGFAWGYSRYKVLKEDERNFKYSNSGIYGTAGMAEIDDLVEKGYACVKTPQAATGKILGQLDSTGNKLITINPKTALNRHIAIVGASGSGKSRCFARPFIIQCVKNEESIIVTDPKGELYESTAQYLSDHGYKVRTFDLVHPRKSDGWNCIKELFDENGNIDEIRAQIFADVVIKNTGDAKGDVWDNAAMALLKGLLLRVALGDDFADNRSFGSAYDLIQNPQGEDFLDTMFALKGDASEIPPYMGPYMTFKQGSPNMRGNIITGLATRLQVLQNQIIKTLTSKDEIDLVLPSEEKCAYFCIMSDQHSTLNFLSTLFFSFLFIDLVEHADASEGNRCKIPVNFLLDEFPNIGSIPDFDKKIATVRSRFINIVLIFQNIPQMMEKYPLGKWEGILGNCDTMICLGANDQTTANFLSERTGIATVQVHTEQHSKNDTMFTLSHNSSTGDGKRQIMNADEILRMKWEETLIIFRGQNVLKANKYDFSLHPESKKFTIIKKINRPDINAPNKEEWLYEQDNTLVLDFNESVDDVEIIKQQVSFSDIKDEVQYNIRQFNHNIKQRMVEHEINAKQQNQVSDYVQMSEKVDWVYDESELHETSSVEINSDDIIIEDFGDIENYTEQSEFQDDDYQNPTIIDTKIEEIEIIEDY